MSLKRKKPYNKGDAYEAKIVKIMSKKGMLPANFKRAGAGTGTDAKFIHKRKEYNLEIKNGLSADYGQKTLRWSFEKGWEWCVDDETTQMYTAFGILDYLRSKKIIPNKFRKKNCDLTPKDKKDDQKKFEDRTWKTGGSALLNYYKIKNVFYLQIGEGYGFYSLYEDPANLAATKFNGEFTLRLRAKTIRSKPISNYGFYAVLKPSNKPIPSDFNLEGKNKKQKFPKIMP